MTESCPCESGAAFADCCEAIVSGRTLAESATTLMRSRYTAYTLSIADHLLSTWHPSTRPRSIDFNPQQKWLGLKIKNHELGTETDDTGVVEFVARFKIGGQGHRLHERSRFAKVGDAWFYLDGMLNP